MDLLVFQNLYEFCHLFLDSRKQKIKIVKNETLRILDVFVTPFQITFKNFLRYLTNSFVVIAWMFSAKMKFLKTSEKIEKNRMDFKGSTNSFKMKKR